MNTGTGTVREVPDNILQFARPASKVDNDEIYLEMKEMLFLMCEVLSVVLPVEQIELLGAASPGSSRGRARLKNWLKRSYFFRGSRLQKAFRASGVQDSDAMAEVILYEFQQWLSSNNVV